jgi:alpha,alpha-trehalase
MKLWSSHGSLIRAAAVLSFFSAAILMAQDRSPMRTVIVDTVANLERLIADEDTDGDKKLTVDDVRISGTDHGDRRFRLVSIGGGSYWIEGTYYLANLLQELKLAESAGEKNARLDENILFMDPVHRVSRMIRQYYWDGLTRRIDAAHLESVLADEKVSSGAWRYLYVPADDDTAYSYFSRIASDRADLRLRVERLPRDVTPEYVRGLAGRHGLLALALRSTPDGDYEGVPYVVPGGRFNEMYGWDSYFESLGLLEDGRTDLARAMVDNFVYEIRHYGKILNANRTYYLTRSQPPFLTSMALAVYAHLNHTSANRDWLSRVFEAAVLEYRNVWMNSDHLTATGLSRYYGSGSGPPPEVEAGHFDAIFRPYAANRHLDLKTFEEGYRAGRISVPELDQFFVNDRCVRESGHDTTYRWDWRGDGCADFVTVDLNSLLYRIERDIGETIDREFGGAWTLSDGSRETGADWLEKAARRKELVDKYLWDAARGMYFDYDYRRGERSVYVSATTFYPLWAGMASPEQARRVPAAALPQLEMPGGLAASAENSRGPVSAARPARQWDYPYGWAPHQMLAWRGFINYGQTGNAIRLAYRWLYTIARNAADYNGTIPEKFNVVTRSHAVFAEYGNVGTQFSYITREGFGWMNASFQVGLKLLPDELQSRLERLVPPEWIFGAEPPAKRN